MGPILQFTRPHDVFDARNADRTQRCLRQGYRLPSRPRSTTYRSRDNGYPHFGPRGERGARPGSPVQSSAWFAWYSTIDAEYGRALMSPLPVD
jgi:hypothetical protein